MAEVGLDHLLVRRDLLRAALGDQPALRQHPHMLGQVHHGLHHVFDHQHRHAAVADAAHHRHHFGDLLRVQAGQYLVEQQQARPGGQRACQLQPLAAGHGEVGGRLVQLRRQAHPLRHVLGLCQRLRAAAHVQVGADRNVLAHGLGGEGLHDLEGARHAGARVAMRLAAGDVLAGEAHGARVGLQEAGHQREQRGLACAVGPDQRAQVPLGQCQAHVLHRLQPTERAGDAHQLQQRLSHGGLPSTAAAPTVRDLQCRAARRSRSAPAPRRRSPC
jgi:hypothetical protein